MQNYVMQNLYWEQLNLARLDDDRRDRVKGIGDKIMELSESHGEKKNVIKGDGDLSQSGRDSRLRALAKASTDSLNRLTSSILSELDNRIVELETAAGRAVAGQADDASRTLLKIEARQLAAAIDPLLLTQDYLLLCRDGSDDLTAEALEQAPRFGRRLSAATLSEGMAIRAARLQPDRTEELRQIREMRHAIGTAQTAARREFAEYLSDPIAEMATGRATAV